MSTPAGQTSADPVSRYLPGHTRGGGGTVTESVPATGGVPVITGVTDNDIEHRHLVGASGITVAPVSDRVQIAAELTDDYAGGGERVVTGTAGMALSHRGVAGGDAITVTPSGTALTLDWAPPSVTVPVGGVPTVVALTPAELSVRSVGAGGGTLTTETGGVIGVDINIVNGGGGAQLASTSTGVTNVATLVNGTGITASGTPATGVTVSADVTNTFTGSSFQVITSTAGMNITHAGIDAGVGCAAEVASGDITISSTRRYLYAQFLVTPGATTHAPPLPWNTIAEYPDPASKYPATLNFESTRDGTLFAVPTTYAGFSTLAGWNGGGVCINVTLASDTPTAGSLGHIGLAIVDETGGVLLNDGGGGNAVAVLGRMPFITHLTGSLRFACLLAPGARDYSVRFVTQTAETITEAKIVVSLETLD